jgi:hypothetical protein
MGAKEIDTQEHPELKKENPQTRTYRVEMTWDARTNAFTLKAKDIPTIVLYGMIQMGLSCALRDQVTGQVMGILTHMAGNQKPGLEVVPANAMPKGEGA